MQKGTNKLEDLKTLVLDEADRMINRCRYANAG
ncbi:hypothetical protein [Luminiphilus syltensis]